MDRGIGEGRLREALVVGVGNTAERIWEYTPTDGGHGGGGAAVYLGFLADELKPVLDGELRTRPEREHTALVGSSLGGLVSVWGGLSRHESFGLVGALSPSTWWDGRWILAEVRGAAVLPLRVYVDSGDAGASRDGVDDTAELAAAFRARGVELAYRVQVGATHNEIFWRQRLPGALAFLVGPGR
jgi:enterochelin esterase-like enzyme